MIDQKDHKVVGALENHLCYTLRLHTIETSGAHHVHICMQKICSAPVSLLYITEILYVCNQEGGDCVRCRFYVFNAFARPEANYVSGADPGGGLGPPPPTLFGDPQTS